MYLYGQRSASNLGSYLRGTGRLGSLGFRPNQAAQRIYRRRPPVSNGLRGYRGIGDDSTDPFAGISPGDLTALATPAPMFDPTESIATGNMLVDPTTLGPTPSQAFSVLQENLTPSSSAADYVSPQAAISAGLPASTVNATWATSQGVNSFSSPQAATAALTASMGAAQAAATVAKLWSGGGQAAPVSAGFLNSSTAGIPNTVLIGGGLLVLLLGMMGGKR